MYKNYNEEQLVLCADCGEYTEKKYTIICSGDIICDQCVIDSGGDYFDDDRDAPFDLDNIPENVVL